MTWKDQYFGLLTAFQYYRDEGAYETALQFLCCMIRLRERHKYDKEGA